MDKCLIGNKIAPLQQVCLALLSTCVKVLQFYCLSLAPIQQFLIEDIFEFGAIGLTPQRISLFFNTDYDL